MCQCAGLILQTDQTRAFFQRRDPFFRGERAHAGQHVRIGISVVVMHVRSDQIFGQLADRIRLLSDIVLPIVFPAPSC